jgi:hypothetical protein
MTEPDSTTDKMQNSIKDAEPISRPCEGFQGPKHDR